MTASIQSTLLDSPAGTPVGAPVVGASRDDLRKGYQVVLESVNASTTYKWVVEFAPDAPDGTASSATLDLNAFGSFTIVDTTLMSVGDHITIGGFDLTAVAGAPGLNEFQIIVGNEIVTAANAAAAIQNPGSFWAGYVSATWGGATTVDLVAAVPGTAGDAIDLSVTSVNPGVITVSGANFVGGSDNFSQIVRFNVDHEGPYLVKLTVDAGLPGEDTQYVRLRFLTRFADVPLIAGGERRDSSGVIPVDVDVEGWSQEQNKNVQRLLAMVRRQTTSGRSLYVDANRGRDNTNTPNDLTNPPVDFPGSDPADVDGSGISMDTEGFADFSSIQDAIAYALDYASRSEPAPSFEEPFTIYVQPGLYVEDLALQPHVHIVGLGAAPFQESVSDLDLLATYDIRGGNHVIIRTANTGGNTHEFSPASGVGTDMVVLENLILENTDVVTTEPVLKHTKGLLVLNRVAIEQKGTAATQGPALGQITADTTASLVCVTDQSYFRSLAAFPDRYAVIIDAPLGYFIARDSRIQGAGSGIAANPSLYSTVSFDFVGLERCVALGGPGGVGFRGYGGQMSIDESFIATLTFDAFGAPPASKTGPVTVLVRNTQVNGPLTFDTAGTAGSSNLTLDASSWSGGLVFPTALPGGTPQVQSYSIEYDRFWTDPVPPNDPAVPSAIRLASTNVQDAIDELTLLTRAPTTTSVAVGGVYVLLSSTSYLGVDTVTPAAIVRVVLPSLEGSGAVDGRRITIKDEGGGAGVVGQEILVYVNGPSGTIDGTIRSISTPIVMNTNYQSLTLVCRGESGGTSHWYIV
jgi:hypothetical protein